MDTVYLETSIISHAAARPSSDVQIAAFQQQARLWWSNERMKFALVASQLVVDEAAAGDSSAAAERLKMLEGLPLLAISDRARVLAREILSHSLLPQKAAADALHIAVAATAGIQYLLTLNCKHIANARELPRVYRLLDQQGFGQLLICTPAEFLGGGDDDDQQSHP